MPLNKETKPNQTKLNFVNMGYIEEKIWEALI